MVKRGMSISLMFVVVSLMSVGFSFGEESKEELKLKLAKVRAVKSDLMRTYDENIAQINKEAEERMADIRRDYRIAREDCLNNQKAKSNTLYKDYQTRLKEILKEEQQLIEMVGPQEAMNFAKPR